MTAGRAAELRVPRRGATVDETLLRAIQDTFPDGQPPQRPLTAHRCPECDEVDILLGDHVWSEVAARFPNDCHDAFPLLTAAAQTYYLPAYVSAALQENAGLQGASLETALAEGGLD